MMMIGIERKMIVDPVIVLLLLTAEMAEGMKPDVRNQVDRYLV
jgi:hypothetical protein